MHAGGFCRTGSPATQQRGSHRLTHVHAISQAARRGALAVILGRQEHQLAAPLLQHHNTGQQQQQQPSSSEREGETHSLNGDAPASGAAAEAEAAAEDANRRARGLVACALSALPLLFKVGGASGLLVCSRYF